MQAPNKIDISVDFDNVQNATKEELMAVQKVADAVKEANALGLTVMVAVAYRQPLGMSNYGQNVKAYRKNVR